MGDLEGDVDRLGDRQRAGCLDPLADRHALDVLEGDVVDRSVLADAVDPRDVLVVELGGGSPLLVEPADDLRVGGLIRRQQLERDLAVELGVERRKTAPIPPTPIASSSRKVSISSPGSGQRDRCGARELLCRLSEAELFEPAETVTRGVGLASSTRSPTRGLSLAIGNGLGGCSPVGLRGSELNIDSCSMAWGSSPGNTSMPSDRSRYRAK